MVDFSPGDQTASITQPVLIEQTQQPEVTMGNGNVGEVTSQSSWSQTVYSSSRMVMETVENMYNRTAQATGLLPQIDRYVVKQDPIFS